MIYDIDTRWDSAYKMLSRALYLRKAIDRFLADDEELRYLQLEKKEWNQAAIIVTILLPFKMTSQRLQATKRPGIDSVFWDYESMFNKIDAVKETLSRPDLADKEWIQELHNGVEIMSLKLQKYYSKTSMPFVYSDACILEPFGKTILFKQERFGGGPAGRWVEKYKTECRDRYINEYESIPMEGLNSRKRKHDEPSDDDDDDDPNDYRAYMHKQTRESAEANELERYLLTPTPHKKIKTLAYWKEHLADFPQLSLMARDTFAVPATSAGVERTFSKSGRIATWTRAKLHSNTITEMMLYKEFLNRIGMPLNREVEKHKADRRKGLKKNKETATVEVNSDSEDNDDDEPVLIQWELE
jgi:hypothetical protein